MLVYFGLLMVFFTPYFFMKRVNLYSSALRICGHHKKIKIKDSLSDLLSVQYLLYIALYTKHVKDTI